MYQTMCLARRLFYSNDDDAINKQFTNWVTQSILQIQSPHFYYAQPSQAQAVEKKSGFVSPSTNQVTWLVNC